MATDVARRSFDPARRYRGVVPQQGRVSLEAEQNEQREIDSEERRQELLDIVGPAGTPDDGYAVTGGSGFDLTIGAGTMYVGGWRVELDADLDVAAQPDWLDSPEPPNADHQPGGEHVLLWLRETDVTAVEDPALYEVALGGPDGAARTRLLQRIVREPTEGRTCAAALAEDRKRWLADGLKLNRRTMQLESLSRLLVTWEGDPEPPNPCEPASVGGYLGAENQCIRVQITAVNEDGTVDLLWGYDDASFLYRVSADASTNPVLTLDRTPVDDYHRPRAGQAVQALRATAELASTDGVVEGYVAALNGVVGVLTAPYDPDTKTVPFPGPLPAEYTNADDNPQLYLRVWEELLTGVALDTAVSLTGTGMQVSISSAGRGPVHVDDFWCIGVRPATPTTVYPDRYLREAQPPDGPRQWVCPLAVIDWPKRELVVVEDCRRPFPALVDIESTGCCTYEVHPSDAPRLQAILDKAAAGRTVGDRADRVTVCFDAGRYELTEPLVLTKRHSNLTLRGCNEAAVLAVAAGHEAEFGHGMIVLVDADNVTITGFEFTMPQVPATIAQVRGSSGGVFNRDAVRAINAEAGNRYVSLAVRSINCAVLEIDNCLFRFSVGEHETTLEQAQTMPRNVLGIGVFAAGGAWGLRLTRNRFLHDPTVPATRGGVVHLLAGYVLTQTAAATRTEAKTRSLGASALPALLEDALIADNEFRGLSVAVAVVADIAELRVRDNVVKDCYGGVWLFDAASAANTDLLTTVQVRGAAAAATQASHSALTAGLFDAVMLRLIVLAALYPLPHVDDLEVRGVREVVGAEPRARSAQRQQVYMTQLLSRIAADHPATDAAATDAPGTRRAATSAAKKAGAAAAKQSGAAPKVTAAAFGPVAALDLNPDLLTVWAGLAELSRVSERDEVTTSVRVERNSIDCAVPENGATGPALFTYLPSAKAVARAGEGIAAVAVDGNRLVSANATLTAAVLGGTVGTVNLNTVLTGGKEAIALAVGLVEAVAITGNVVAGRALLPVNRPFPAPFDTWLPLNTVG